MGRVSHIAVVVFFFSFISDPAVNAAPQRLFEESTPLELSVAAPLQVLLRDREQEPELPAVLKYRENNGNEVVVTLQIKPRGLSRLRHCRFPPLRFNFKAEDVSGTLFEGQDKLKLVTHCRSSISNRNYIAREYQIYRAYNLVTDYSFRVRWVTVHYTDTESGSKSYTEPGFLIEADWAVAERLGTETLEVQSLEVPELDRAGTAVMSMFQYLIGNMDWSALKGAPGDFCCHNFKVLAGRQQPPRGVLLPYDFDQSNFVDADYAVHNASLGLSRNQRMYKGYCELNDEINTAVSRLNGIRQEWLDLLNNEPVGLTAQGRELRFIERGFEIINDPKRLARDIQNKCR